MDVAQSRPWAAPASVPATAAIMEALRAAGRTLQAIACAYDALDSQLSAELVRAAARTVEAAIAVS